MEIVSADGPCRLFPIRQDRKQIVEGDPKGRPGVHPLILPEFLKKGRSGSEAPAQGRRLEAGEVRMMLGHRDTHCAPMLTLPALVRQALATRQAGAVCPHIAAQRPDKRAGLSEGPIS